ncbi:MULTISPECIES: rhodanese-like domain-containing protein [Geobacillus]|uniref:Rhodanese-like domain-containing protein n=2 Tax=Anoxybacillaceae TaxID=3120669 RepID=A0A1Q5T5I7_9BACL|nr:MULTISPECIES: rhodanese-like domain-containing protein [Geobacillus]ASS86230.1 hypothetical protein GLN3_03295 [Geobacillus lituanicus]AMV11212.1 hypothetical protein GT3570_09735 [Geobacillus thermoleovorans]KDE48175.1 hypothetical protein DI44_10465 [Geobacillus sp. CAMR5420]OKO95458.1 Zn-dependent hydroxyacylglutathione hydrolase [Geobacillus proteiniphilus]OPX02785.1 rhodanese-like domain-containing protein [Geobacillus sp. LEMMY01]
MAKTISVKEIANQIMRGEELFIVDARNPEDFADWRIEGKGVEVVNIPYFDVLDGIEPYLDRLPKDKSKTIYAVCAKGGSSEFVAEQLEAAGYTDVYSIEGGMKTCSAAECL